VRAGAATAREGDGNESRQRAARAPRAHRKGSRVYSFTITCRTTV